MIILFTMVVMAVEGVVVAMVRQSSMLPRRRFLAVFEVVLLKFLRKT